MRHGKEMDKKLMKIRLLLRGLVFAAAIMIVSVLFASCSKPGFPYGSSEHGGSGIPGVNGYPTVAQQLAYWQQNAYSGGSFVVVARADEVLYYTKTIHYLNRPNVTITIRSYDNTRRILSLNGNKTMFLVQGLNTLILENILLQGHGSNYHSLVVVNQGSELVMKDNSVIRGNRGRGVFVNGGVFTMKDNASITANLSEGVQAHMGMLVVSRVYMYDNAQIYNNVGGMSAVDSILTMRNYAEIHSNRQNGGVTLSGVNARLFMHDEASISNNVFYGVRGAGGVFAQNNARIYMYEDASISDNFSNSVQGGGGVTLFGAASLNMHGDDIKIGRNMSFRSPGGGVWMNSGTLNISGGRIYGNDFLGSVNGNNNSAFPNNHHALHITGSGIARTVTYDGSGNFSAPGANMLSTDGSIIVWGNGSNVIW